MKRFIDALLSIVGILTLSPVFVIVAVLIKFSSRGSVIYKQKRVGLHDKDFVLFKFRTMHTNSEQKGLITVGKDDPRVTKVGFFLRKLKIDEILQLFNILKGDMSFVGPRPEVRKYVKMYPEKYKKILTVRPGLTDKASLKFSNENEILSTYSDAETAYINIILPQKLDMAIDYVNNRSLIYDCKIIFFTAKKIILGN